MGAYECYLCRSTRHERVSGRVRDLPALGILRCLGCGLVFLDDQSHITDDYYNERYTETTHQGEEWEHLLGRARADDRRWTDWLEPLATNKRLLDVGCGAGGLLLNAQAFCLETAGVEPQERWRKTLSEKGVRMFESLDEAPGGSFDVVTLLHVVEHLKDPAATLRLAARKLAPGGRLVVEVPNADDALLTVYASKAFSEFTYWSAHLYLFNAAALARLFRLADLVPVHISHVQRYPLSNHLRWLASGLPGGHIDWHFLDSTELTSAYARQLAAIGRTDTLVATAAVRA